jgi:hypothetical protein
MARFQLLPGAVGIDLPDGSSIKADRTGQVRVDDHAAEAIRGSAAMRRYDAIVEVPPAGFAGVRGAGEAACAGCNFRAWPWQKTCPRCGGPLEAQ